MFKTVIKNLILIMLAAAVIAAGYLLNTREPSAPKTQSKAGILQDTFADVAEKCIPAVVIVTTGRNVAVMSPGENIYDYIYGRGRVTYQPVPTGQGSGFFVDSAGHILTNYHIVKGQSFFKVVLSDGTEYEAKLVGVDPFSDLALLKIATDRKFSYLEFADTGKVKAGHWAIAIGAPFSLAHTVTIGIVSHMKRTVGLNVHENYIQTDASINPGNSGGPLLNLEGKVIGVNDFIMSPSAGNIGLSFAIDGNLAKNICDELLKQGRVERPWLGITMRQLSQQTKQSLSLDGGVAIAKVFRQGPADKANLLAGDIILEADGKKTNSPHDVQMSALEKHSGDQLNLKIYREGVVFDVQIKLECPNVNLRQFD